MRVNNENLLEVDGEPQETDMSASFDMKPVWLGHIAQYAIQLVFTGTPQGNFKLQASCDPGLPNAQGEAVKYSTVVNWTDIADSAATISAAGDLTWNAENVGYEWVRVVWTQTGSSGTLTSARCKVKGV
jgi:hypothetical protein